ncbi:hypothetical protein TorRG33x02_221080 [Trema orientale]|uniref:Uncharacterized protein n=1 Tax=Trema orientale TaxID=63057 RepID=A0A2P5E993_TREOI|nr:hypothetical protein TorRG33x02_221080 [Trema orientale]
MEEVGNIVSILLRYEHLPEFCFFGRIISHQDRDCSKRGDLAAGDDCIMHYQYGLWLWASTLVVCERTNLGSHHSYLRLNRTRSGSGDNDNDQRSQNLRTSNNDNMHGECNFLGDEYREVEEEITKYGVKTIERLQAIKGKEFNDQYKVTRRIFTLDNLKQSHLNASLVSSSMEITGNQHAIAGSAINIEESDIEDNPRRENLSILPVHGEVLPGAKSPENLMEKMKRASVNGKGPRENRRFIDKVSIGGVSKQNSLSRSKARLASSSKHKILEYLEIIDGVGKKLKSYMEEVNPEILKESAMQVCQEQ